MSWAGRRQALILICVGSVAVALLAVTLISVLYEAPSCVDKKQNQDETGIDCGGSCPYLCGESVVPPRVSFVRAFTLPNGRTDVIAFVENPNPTAAAKDVRYTIELFSTDQTLIAERSGVTDLPPAASVPVYIPNFATTNIPGAQAFFSFDDTSFAWFRSIEEGTVSVADDIQIVNLEPPRITATISNPTPERVRNLKVVAVVFDESDNAIAASQTIVPEIAAFGRGTATFTWNEPFSGTPVRVDARVILPLP